MTRYLKKCMIDIFAKRKPMKREEKVISFELKHPEKFGYTFLECEIIKEFDNFIAWKYYYRYKDYPAETDWFPSKNVTSAKSWIKRNIMFGNNGIKIIWTIKKVAS